MPPFPKRLLCDLHYEPAPVSAENIIQHSLNKADPRDETAEFAFNVERLAREYVTTGRLHLQCTKLRGPFEKGWKNPWRPKQSLDSKSPSESQVSASSQHSSKRQKLDTGLPSPLKILPETQFMSTPMKAQSSLPTPSESGHGLSGLRKTRNPDPSQRDSSSRSASPSDARQSRKISKSRIAKPEANLPKPKACVQCGKTDSKIWRKGPEGPGTLCASCGSKWVYNERKRKEQHVTAEVELGVLSPRKVARQAAVRKKASAKSARASKITAANHSFTRQTEAHRPTPRDHDSISKLVFPTSLARMEQIVHREAVNLRQAASPLLIHWQSRYQRRDAPPSPIVAALAARPAAKPKKRVDFGTPKAFVEPAKAWTPVHNDRSPGVVPESTKLRETDVHESMSKAFVEQTIMPQPGEKGSTSWQPAEPAQTAAAQEQDPAESTDDEPIEFDLCSQHFPSIGSPMVSTQAAMQQAVTEFRAGLSPVKPFGVATEAGSTPRTKLPQHVRTPKTSPNKENEPHTFSVPPRDFANAIDTQALFEPSSCVGNSFASTQKTISKKRTKRASFAPSVVSPGSKQHSTPRMTAHEHQVPEWRTSSSFESSEGRSSLAPLSPGAVNLSSAVPAARPNSNGGLQQAWSQGSAGLDAIDMGDLLTFD